MSVNDLIKLIKDVKNVVLLNALPLNAFSVPVNLKIIPIGNNDVLDIINTLKNNNANVKCYIGHAPTASLIAALGLTVNCTRAMWTYDGSTDLILAAVLKTRPAAPGAGDVNVTLSDLLFYIIVPTPLT
jgi:hypothetical protein